MVDGFFYRIVKKGVFKANNILHKEFLLFVFLPIIQKELNEFMQIWNNNNIRKSAEAPGGVSDILFYIPSSVFRFFSFKLLTLCKQTKNIQYKNLKYI